MVEGQRCTDDRHAPGQLALDCDTELPTLRGARLEQRVGACCAESLSARCTEQSRGTAVDHGLGGGDDDDRIRLEQRGVNTERNPSRLPDLDEIWIFRKISVFAHNYYAFCT